MRKSTMRWLHQVFLLMALAMFAAIPTEGGAAGTVTEKKMNREERRAEIAKLQRAGHVPGAQTTLSIAEQRLHAVTEARSLGTRDDKTGVTTFTDEERRQARLWLGESQDLRSEASDSRLTDKINREMEYLEDRDDRLSSGETIDGRGERISRDVQMTFGQFAKPADPDYEKAFRYALLAGASRAMVHAEHGPHIQRALDNTTDIGGGYLVAPQQFTASLLKLVDDAVFVRQHATVTRLNSGDSIGRPSMDSRFSNPAWTAEIEAAPADTTTPFGKRELEPHPLSKLVKVSNKLLRSAALPIDQIVRNELKYVVGITEENAFMNGSGVEQPLGMFVASPDGISTARDMITGNTTTAPTFIGLKRAKYSVKVQYWPRSRWIFHRTVALLLALEQDDNGKFIWEENVKETEQPRLLANPVDMSEYAPDTIAVSAYVGIFGDISNYWIADSLQVQIQVLQELYALTNQVGYIVRKETDGMPVLEEAFARVQLAAS